MTKPAEKEGTTKKPNLIELADARRQIIEKVIAQSGEITPEDEAALSEADSKLEEKLEAYLAVIDRFNDLAERAKIEAEIASAYAGSCLRAVEGLKNRIVVAMSAADTKSIKAGYRTVSRVAGKPSVKILNESLLPPSVATVKFVEKLEIDKKRILTILQAGELVEGAILESGRDSIRVTSPRRSSEIASANAAEGEKSEVAA